MSLEGKTAVDVFPTGREKFKNAIRPARDGSSICSCEFDELLGVHCAGFCDQLRKTAVFGGTD